MKRAIGFIIITYILGASLAYADCSVCPSEQNCDGRLVLCEDFDTNNPTPESANFPCPGGGKTTWHNLRTFPDTADCSTPRWDGEVTVERSFSGTRSFLSKVTSRSDGSSTGYDGIYAAIQNIPTSDEVWVRWYIYVPSANYYTGGGGHCNHHNFLNDGAGAYPSIDFRHFFWQKDGVGQSDYKYVDGDDGKLYIGVHAYALTGGEHFQAHGQTYQEGPPAFALSDHFDEWFCLEWYVQQSTKRMKLWINGVQTVDTGSTMTFSKTPSSRFVIGSYNCQNNDVGTTWKIYIDNIAVSTEGYIGPLGGDQRPSTRILQLSE